jgi:hypothetical protein
MEKKTVYKIFEECLKKRGHWEDFGVNESMILRSSGKK